jgi:hypothetical protein
MFLGADWDDEGVMKDTIHAEYVRSSVQNIDRKLCREKPRGSSKQMEE